MIVFPPQRWLHGRASMLHDSTPRVSFLSAPDLCSEYQCLLLSEFHILWWLILWILACDCSRQSSTQDWKFTVYSTALCEGSILLVRVYWIARR